MWLPASTEIAMVYTQQIEAITTQGSVGCRWDAGDIACLCCSLVVAVCVCMCVCVHVSVCMWVCECGYLFPRWYVETESCDMIDDVRGGVCVMWCVMCDVYCLIVRMLLLRLSLSVTPKRRDEDMWRWGRWGYVIFLCEVVLRWVSMPSHNHTSTLHITHYTHK